MTVAIRSTAPLKINKASAVDLFANKQNIGPWSYSLQNFYSISFYLCNKVANIFNMSLFGDTDTSVKRKRAEGSKYKSRCSPSPTPVSYTHLDVYKRQGVSCARLIIHWNVSYQN